MTKDELKEVYTISLIPSPALPQIPFPSPPSLSEDECREVHNSPYWRRRILPDCYSVI